MKKTIVYSIIASQLLFLLFIPVWLELTKYLHPIVLMVDWICVTGIVLFLAFLLTGRNITLSVNLLHTGMFFYSLGLFTLLFFRPNFPVNQSANFIPFDTIRFYLSGDTAFLIAAYNLGANMGLFVPFGLYYRYVKKQSRFTELLLLSAGTVCVIESAQYITRRGSLDVDDLLLNVLGTIIGYFIFTLVSRVFKIRTD